MAEKTVSEELRRKRQIAGRLGGLKKVPKGTAKMDKEFHLKISAMGGISTREKYGKK
jgi:hypothetical protein